MLSYCLYVVFYCHEMGEWKVYRKGHLGKLCKETVVVECVGVGQHHLLLHSREWVIACKLGSANRILVPSGGGWIRAEAAEDKQNESE